MKYSDIEDAFHFVSRVAPEEHYAYIDRETGERYYVSELGDSEELPGDLEENEKYIAVPHKNDLDLGRNLAFDFISEFLPRHVNEVRSIFSRKGAYSSLKNLLQSNGQLEAWYEFENKATEKALREWCKENDIRLED